MPKRITYDMAKDQEVRFEYSADVGYLAIVDLNSYVFSVDENLDYPGMLAHLGQQEAKRTCVAWGCPEADLRVRLIFTRDHKAFESVREYASGFQGWVHTRGHLLFASHDELYYCALNPDRSVFKGPESPDVLLPRELIVPPGTFSVIVFRHFGWFEGSQDAPLLGDGIHYTVILRHYPDKAHLGQLYGPTPVPWTKG
jgi:hypothetical protein